MDGSEAAFADLLDDRKIPHPVDALRAGEGVQIAREAAEELCLGVDDAAGAAVLWLAVRLVGDGVIRPERESRSHALVLALLLRTWPGKALLTDAGWDSPLALRHYDRLAVAYARFRAWVASVSGEFRTGEMRGYRVGLALAASRTAGAADGGNRGVAYAVETHHRCVPVDPEDVPGALLLAREAGLSMNDLIRRTPNGLRWVEKKARDLVEAVTPKPDAVADAVAFDVDLADEVLASQRTDPSMIAENADMLEQVAELGDEKNRRILEGLRRGETQAEVGGSVGMGERAVRKRLTGIKELAQRLSG